MPPPTAMPLLSLHTAGNTTARQENATVTPLASAAAACDVYYSFDLKTVDQLASKCVDGVAAVDITAHSGRAPIRLCLSRRRADFHRPCHFGDTEFNDKSAPNGGGNESEYVRQIIPHYNLNAETQESAWQTAPIRTERYTQTDFATTANQSTEYVRRTLNDDEREKLLSSMEMRTFINGMLLAVKVELDKNIAVDIIANELTRFEEEADGGGSNGQAGKHSSAQTLDTFHSFYHANYSKRAEVTAVKWKLAETSSKPSNVVAFSTAALAQTQRKLAQSANRTHTAQPQHIGTAQLHTANGANNSLQSSDAADYNDVSALLFYDLADLLHPILIVESPLPITTFSFHPTNSDLVAIGLISGQVALLQVKQAAEQLAIKQKRHQTLQTFESYQSRHSTKAGATNSAKAGQLPAAKVATTSTSSASDASVSIVVPIPLDETTAYISALTRSHTRAVTDIHWLDAHANITKKGAPAPNTLTTQFASVAADGKLIIWDSRDGAPQDTTADGNENANANATTEDYNWQPLYVISTNSATAQDAAATGASATSGGSSSSLCLLTSIVGVVGSTLLCASEGGEICECDYIRRVNDDSAVIAPVSRRRQYHVTHSLQPISKAAVIRSPYSPDLFVSIHDWSWALWHRDHDLPLFITPRVHSLITAAVWSASRPSVIICGRDDGTVDVWDCLDGLHRPAFTVQTASKVQVTSMYYHFQRHSASASTVSYLLVGDVSGRCHLLDLPRSLRRRLRNEDATFNELVKREVTRVQLTEKQVGGASMTQTQTRYEVSVAATPARTSASNSAEPSSSAEVSVSGGGDANWTDDDEASERAYRDKLRAFRESIKANAAAIATR